MTDWENADARLKNELQTEIQQLKIELGVLKGKILGYDNRFLEMRNIIETETQKTKERLLKIFDKTILDSIQNIFDQALSRAAENSLNGINREKLVKLLKRDFGDKK